MSDLPTPAIVVRKAKDGTPHYEAKWRSHGRQIKRRLGPAWLDRDGNGWAKRRGRTPDRYLDARTVHIAAADLVAVVEAELEADEARKAQVTVRQLAAEWLAHLEHVDGAKPNTTRNYAIMLREPGTPHKRGGGASPGRIMRQFGDRDIRDVTARQVAEWLSALDAELRSARNVNYHRQVLHAMFEFACGPETHGLPENPVAATKTRKEPAAADLDHYEVHEVEALARAFEQGRHRGARATSSRGAPTAVLSRRQREAKEAEAEAKALDDRRDAEFFRTLFYAGLRFSEGVGLRVRDVQFVADMSGAVLTIQNNISAGEDTTTKSGRKREVPVGTACAAALARTLARDEFTEPDDYVFVNRHGRRLDTSALRRRYKAAAAAAGLRPLRVHDLRHAAGSIMARTLPLVEVRDVLGHAKLSTTSRYLHGKIDKNKIAAMDAAFSSQQPAAEASPLRPRERT